MDKEKMTFWDALKAKPDGREPHEIMESILEKIKEEYDYEITHAEALDIARNLKGFAQTVLEIYESELKEPSAETVEDTNEEEKWTYKDVAYAFERAIRTLKLLPGEKVRGYRTLWPDINYTEAEILQQTASRHLKLRPKAEDVTNLEKVLEWITWVDVDDRKIIWARANRLPWKVVCRQIGFERTRAWELWRTSLNKIANKLNEKGIGKTTT